jgi:hypothetical protein
MFWLPAMGWLLSYDTPVPAVDQPRFPQNRADLRRFALESYLKALGPDADNRLRTVALNMFSQTELRSHPDAIAALSKLRGGQAARYLPDRYRAELEAAIKEDTFVAKLELTPARLRNFQYFLDYMVPEMNLENREDGNSCFTCHGSGRVPSFELAAPDRRTGFLAARDAWKNYRAVLERAAKIVQKPLNIQDGKEDGHQGGRRYAPGDRGHEIIRRWVADIPQT